MTSNRRRIPGTSAVVVAGMALAVLFSWSPRATGVEVGKPAAGLAAPAGQATEVHVTGRRYEYAPARIEVDQDDLVKVVFSCEDIAHSFTVDAYRISKRASPGQPVVFEFRADQPGRFPIYCALAIDDGCRQMHGELVVRPR